MGSSITHFAVIGIRVDMTRYLKKVQNQERIGNQNVPLHWKHDPETGESLWRTRTTYSWVIEGEAYEYIHRWGGTKEEGSFEPFETIPGFGCFAAPDLSGEMQGSKIWYFGQIISHRDDYAKPMRHVLRSSDPQHVEDIIREHLPQIPWEPDQFGIHFFSEVY